MSKSNQLKAFRAAFPHTVPIMAAYLVLSFAYGIIMQSKGYNPVLAVALSALVYGGSLQYAAVDLFTTGFDPLSDFRSTRGIFFAASECCRGLPIRERCGRFCSFR